MWNDRFRGEGLSLWGRVAFDPVTMTAVAVGGSMAATAVGGAMSAQGTLAGGNFAQQAGQMQKTAAYAQADEQEYEAKQVDQNAGQAVASAQRTALDTEQKTRLAISSSRALAAGSGVNAGVGSAVTNEGQLAQRGSYNALMDMFNGQSTATGLNNKATAMRYGEQITRYGGDVAAVEGDEKKTLSEYAAAGTLASTAGKMFSQAGGAYYPQSFRGS